MLEILNETEIRTPEEVEKLYPNCQYILINFKDIEDLRGNLYCISRSKDSYRALWKEYDKLSEQGIACFEGGEYKEGGAIGVQYEYSK